MKKLLVLPALILLFCFVGLTSPVHAITCDDPRPTEKGPLEEYIADCNSKLGQLSGQRQTLASAIAYLNTQIKLAQAKIATTTNQLENLEVEIADLTGRIDSIDYSLVDLTKLFVSRVRQTYMERGTYDAFLISQSTGLPDFLRTIEYTKKVRDHDREILIALEKSRLDASSQKALKEAKLQEIETLKRKLDADRAALNSQVAAKNALLSETKNDEARYQKLRSDAQAQLAAFNRFVSGQGGATILSGTTKTDPGWGTYYNQRDSQWGTRTLGVSNITVAEAGCLITSMSMIMTHYGKSVNPGDIASNASLFSSYNPAYFMQGDLTINGVGTNRTPVGYSQTALDNELGNGKPVILGVSPYGSSQPEHFIVVKQKEGDDYLINDPFIENGMNIKFKSHYSLASIRRVDRVSVN